MFLILVLFMDPGASYLCYVMFPPMNASWEENVCFFYLFWLRHDTYYFSHPG